MKGEERTPADRDFRPGEFEELYKWRPLNDFERLIRKSIEFPEEYFEAGKSILSYFGSILRKKYPDAKANVQIRQDGLKVTMTIDPADGDREVLEKELDRYGLVITGKMAPEEFTDDRLLIHDLKNELRIAHHRIESQKELLAYQNEDMRKKDIRIDRFLDIMEKGIQAPVNMNVFQTQGEKIDGSSQANNIGKLTQEFDK